MNLNRRDCREVHHIFVLLDQDVRKFKLASAEMASGITPPATLYN